MKIVLIHGEDTGASRKRLVSIITKFKLKGEVIRLVPDSLGLKEAIASGSLFGSQSLYVVEDVAKFPLKDFDWVFKNQDKYASNLLIWHKAQAPAALSKLLPKEIKIELFAPPRVIFTFLDSLVPGRGKYVLQTLHNLLKQEPLEMVFAMIARHFRDLYWAGTDSGTIPYPAWRVSKLKKQSSLFGLEKLGKVINLLATADVNAKTSKGELILSLDLIFASQLE